MTLLKQKMLDTYKFAYSYLVNMLPAEMTEADLGKYFIGDRRDFASVQDIYEQFIYSAQNYQSMPNVIKYDLRREKMKEIQAVNSVRKAAIANGMSLEQSMTMWKTMEDVEKKPLQ